MEKVGKVHIRFEGHVTEITIFPQNSELQELVITLDQFRRMQHLVEQAKGLAKSQKEAEAGSLFLDI